VLLFSLILYVSVFDVKRWVRDAQADRVEAQTPATAAPKPAAAP
jgi:hypothetical protein